VETTPAASHGIRLVGEDLATAWADLGAPARTLLAVLSAALSIVSDNVGQQRGKEGRLGGGPDIKRTYQGN
jgi:hypothetical protein